MHGLNLYDYSARYYEGALGRFTSVDPLATLDYNWSPYVYVDNNPLRWIDPSGMKKGDPNDPVELNEVTVTPSSSQGSNSVGASTLFILFVRSQQQTYGAGLDYIIRKDHSPLITDLAITGEFLLGSGPQKRKFGPNSSSSKSLKKSHLTRTALRKYFKYVKQYGGTKHTFGVGFNPLESHDSGPFRELLHDNNYNTAQFVGSANYTIEQVGNELNVTVYNSTNLKSAAYHIPFVGEPSRSETPMGAGGKIEQTYSFSISLQEAQNIASPKMFMNY